MRAKTKKRKIARGPRVKSPDTCRVEAVISVDGRGQMVLPKELRAKAHIKANDKLTAITWSRGKKVCCISIIKSDDLLDVIKKQLKPMMKDMLKK